MIVGIGTDLVEIARIRRILEQPHGPRFVERLLTPAERELAAARGGGSPGRLAEFVAGRFAAKEAVAKALGCGIGRQVGLQDISVLPGALGKPDCRVSDAALARLGLGGGAEGGSDGPVGGERASAAAAAAATAGLRIHISITHTETTAAAFAVAEQARE
ncbi:holo-ACP synthase [Paenibacillus koleovorans]|uniref:holo-ACP synthase n=1 Tax=Paenibacillus koleovorans TaxID=121608 RepID=UPI000FD8C56E|nr:holo-ACP synthase [Paenibacillus koleovorans]